MSGVAKDIVEGVTESIWTRAISRGAMILGTGIVLPGGIWVITTWLGNLDDQFESMAKEDTEIREQIQVNQDANVLIQRGLTQTIAEVQKAAAAQTATSNAQYLELKDDTRQNDRRLDRLEDRLDGSTNR